MDSASSEPAQPQMRTAAEGLGATLIQDIKREEGNLESLLNDLRSSHTLRPSITGIPGFDSLIPTNAKTTTISGRHLPFLYHLLEHLVLDRKGTVCLLDLTATFSPSHLQLSEEELKHIHVFFPTKATLSVTLKGLDEYMLYGEGSIPSRGREWVGTIVVGGLGGNFAFVWKGFLKVALDSARHAGFGAAVSVEEAVNERRRKIKAVSVDLVTADQSPLRKRWRVSGENGSYSWSDDVKRALV